VEVVLFLIGAITYFTPTIVALARKAPSPGSTLVVNFFVGWTLVGWVVALAMAFRDKRAS